MNRQNTGSAWVPWALVPLLLLLNVRYHPFPNVLFDLTLLQIPVAIGLTCRYGWHGFAAAVIGSFPLVARIYLGPLTYGGQLTMFVIVVSAAWLTLNKTWLESKKIRPPGTAMMILLLLVGSSGLWVNIENFAFGWWGTTFLYFAFFVLGLRGVPVRRWLIIAGMITIAGVLLSLISSFGEELFDMEFGGARTPIEVWELELRLELALNRPGNFLTLLVFFWAGSWLRTFMLDNARTTEAFPRVFKLVAFAAVMYLANPMWQGLVSVLVESRLYERAMFDISPVGSFYILSVLSLLLALSRKNGMLISFALVVVYYVLEGFTRWGSGIFVRIDFGDFALIVAFAWIGSRLARQFPAADTLRTVSWFPAQPAGEQNDIEPDEWKRQHDEISNTVRRVMLSLLAYALFCGLTLAGSDDASLFGVGSEIKLPIANTSIDYAAFLTVGPLILVGLIVYLHLFLQTAVDLGRPPGARPLPYIFNMDNSLARLLSSFLHYWLPVLLLFQFAWKATPQPIAGFWLGLASTGLGIFMAYFYMLRLSAERTGGPHRFILTMFFIFGLLFAIQLASGGAVLKRPLLLNGADFKGRDLGGVDLREAVLVGVNFTESSLQRADLRRAILSEAKIKGANFTEADLRGVRGLGCEQLQLAIGWEKAYRDERLSCGSSIPELPREKQERYKF